MSNPNNASEPVPCPECGGKRIVVISPPPGLNPVGQWVKPCPACARAGTGQAPPAPRPPDASSYVLCCFELRRLWAEAGKPMDLTEFVKRDDVKALIMERPDGY